MDAAPLQVRRKPAGASVIRPVPLVVVVGRRPVEELAPTVLRCRTFAGFRQQRDPSGLPTSVVAGHTGLPPTEDGSSQLTRPTGSGRLPPAMGAPTAKVRSEDGIRAAVRLPHPAWCHGVGRTGRDQLDVLGLQSLFDALVPGATIGSVVGGDMDGICADLARQSGNDRAPAVRGRSATDRPSTRTVASRQPARKCRRGAPDGLSSASSATKTPSTSRLCPSGIVGCGEQRGVVVQP